MIEIPKRRRRLAPLSGRDLDNLAGLKPLRPHNDAKAAERKAQQEAEERRKGERDHTLVKGLRRAFG